MMQFTHFELYSWPETAQTTACIYITSQGGESFLPLVARSSTSFVNISFNVKLGAALLSLLGAFHLKVNHFCEIIHYIYLKIFLEFDLFQRRSVALFFEGASWQNTACGEFWRLQRRKLNAKSVTKIFAKFPIWGGKLWQMHEIGKRVGIRRKRRSTERNIFTVEDWGRGKKVRTYQHHKKDRKSRR